MYKMYEHAQKKSHTNTYNDTVKHSIIVRLVEVLMIRLIALEAVWT